MKASKLPGSAETARSPQPVAEVVSLIRERTKDPDGLQPHAACHPLCALLGSHLQGDGGF